MGVQGATGPNPASGTLGETLVSDGSSVGHWDAVSNDALQAGFAGLTNPGVVTATVNLTTGVLTFTNWPAGDYVWFTQGVSAPLVRSLVPAAPRSAHTWMSRAAATSSGTPITKSTSWSRRLT